MYVSIGYIRRLFIFCCSILQLCCQHRLTEVILLLPCYPMSVSVGCHPAMECCCWLHDFYWAMPGMIICFPSSPLLALLSCVTPAPCVLSANRSRDVKDIPSLNCSSQERHSSALIILVSKSIQMLAEEVHLGRRNSLWLGGTRLKKTPDRNLQRIAAVFAG